MNIELYALMHFASLIGMQCEALRSEDSRSRSPHMIKRIESYDIRSWFIGHCFRVIFSWGSGTCPSKIFAGLFHVFVGPTSFTQMAGK